MNDKKKIESYSLIDWYMNNENTKKFNIEYVFHNKNIRAFNYRNTIISYRKNLFPRLDIHKYIIFFFIH